MKTRILAIFLICALLIPAMSVCAYASDEELCISDTNTEIQIYIPEEQVEEFEAELNYTSKTVYAGDDGIMPYSSYTISLPGYQTSSYSFGYVSSGTTMYMHCSGGGITATLYSGTSSSKITDVVFSFSTSLVDRTHTSTGRYYKFSMYNESSSTITLYLTVYTY